MAEQAQRIRLNVSEAAGPTRLAGEQVRVVPRCVVHVNTTAHWDGLPDYVPLKGDLVIYTDRDEITEGGAVKRVPGVKIGDGSTRCADLPFITDALASALLAHMEDRVAHVSAAERSFWNDKLNCAMDGETLLLTRD